MRSTWPQHLHILNVNVDAGVDVIEQIPADVIRVFVNHKIITAVPTPIGEDWPIPGCNFEIEAARKPEPMTVGIDSQQPVSEIRTKMIEVSMDKGSIQAIHRIVSRVMPVPLIMVDMGRVVDAPVRQSFSTLSRIRASRRRRGRKMTLIGAGSHLLRSAVMLRCSPLLIAHGEYQDQDQRRNEHLHVEITLNTR